MVEMGRTLSTRGKGKGKVRRRTGYLIGFYNRDEKCLLRGTDWAFK